MTVFSSTLNQMAFLMLLIVIGYILVRVKAVPKEGAMLISKLENNVFVPALVMGTFMQNFTAQRMQAAGSYLLCGLVAVLVSIPVAILFARLCTKDEYVRKIYTYGLAFSNFGFMGNAVVSALFPEIFMEYLICVLPFWFFIYIWGTPFLLIPSKEENGGLRAGLKRLANPMFAGMVIGMLIGIANLPVPSFVESAMTTLGSCMSPLAMLLTGMTIAGIDLKATMKNGSIYIISLIRLLLIPAAALAVILAIQLPYELALCAMCALSMPLGLSTIVVPSAYGKDTTVAAGMALISHLLSCLTIPVVFMILLCTFVPSMISQTSIMMVPCGALALAIGFILYKKDKL